MIITKFIASLILLNLFTNDLQITGCQKCIYADDTGPTFAELPSVLFLDATEHEENCCNWRLKPNISRTICSMFGLHNKSLTCELKVMLNSQHDPHPVYLGVPV